MKNLIKAFQNLVLKKQILETKGKNISVLSCNKQKSLKKK